MAMWACDALFPWGVDSGPRATPIWPRRAEGGFFSRGLRVDAIFLANLVRSSLVTMREVFFFFLYSFLSCSHAVVVSVREGYMNFLVLIVWTLVNVPRREDNGAGSHPYCISLPVRLCVGNLGHKWTRRSRTLLLKPATLSRYS
jgi:hypothetical protein